jgi:hypothetical protein
MLGSGGGRSKFEHDVAVAHQFLDGLANRNADPTDPGELADVLVDIAAARRLAAARHRAAFGRGNLGHQHPAHPAATSDDTHLGPGHVLPPVLLRLERLPIVRQNTSRRPGDSA